MTGAGSLADAEELQLTIAGAARARSPEPAVTFSMSRLVSFFICPLLRKNDSAYCLFANFAEKAAIEPL
jgi:hypothetical protein